MGSPSFIPFIEAHRDEFDADVIIVADSGNWSADIPSLTTSLRGNTTLDVHVRVLEHPVHSGQYGGPILDANTLAAMLIASMYNGDGEMQVPGVAAEEPVGGLQRDLDEAMCAATPASCPATVWPAPVRWPSRLWTKPSVTVIGFDAQPVEGSFNVISHETTFRLSLRTAPNQRPEQAQQALADFLVAHAPFGCEVTVTPGENGMGWAMDPNAEATKDALEAMEEAFGVAPGQQGRGRLDPVHPGSAAHLPRGAGAGHRTGGSEGQRAQPERVHLDAEPEEEHRHRGAAARQARPLTGAYGRVPYRVQVVRNPLSYPQAVPCHGFGQGMR